MTAKPFSVTLHNGYCRVQEDTEGTEVEVVGDEGEDGEDDDGEGNGEVEMDEVEEEEMVELPVEDTEMETDGRRSVAFQDLDAEEEERQ